jgi:RNA polymerase sigma-70 factor (ECF subfamily)
VSKTISTADDLVGAAVALPANERLETLFGAHQQGLFGLALRTLGERQAALDLVQETFLRALRHLHRIPADEAAARAWLNHVMMNLARDQWRRRSVRNAFLQRPDSARPAAGPAITAEGLAVRAALGSLTPKRRAIVLMAEVEGHNSVEIARTLGMRPVTVRWHLSAARRQLRSQLQASKPDSGDPR